MSQVFSKESADILAQELLEKHQNDIYCRTDRLFIILMLMQWVGAVLTALIVSPRTWIGDTSYLNITLYASIFFGGLLVSLPAYLAYIHPGHWITRHIIAIGQMMTSTLLIHLSGGRIETHFHVFGSLAFLAFYRDWKVIVTAVVVIAADHMIRGTFYPLSVFGETQADPYRWIEHALWVLFESIFLWIAIHQSHQEMQFIAIKRSRLKFMIDELQEAHSHKDIFITSMSHELKTPLNAIIGFSEILLEEAKDAGDGRAAEDLARINQSGSHLLGLVEALLDMLKIHSGKIEMDLRQYEARQIIDKAIKAASPSILANENQLDLTIAEDLGVMITDRRKLSLVLKNLLNNAGKFCKKGRVEVKVETSQDKKFLLFSVRDTGIGMTPEQIKSAFQRFVQNDASLDRQYEGAGIGLYLTREFCQLLGGSIHVESQLGEGSLFEIQVPFHSTYNHAEQAIRHSESPIIAPPKQVAVL